MSPLDPSMQEGPLAEEPGGGEPGLGPEHGEAPGPSARNGREAFVREPAPCKTQPASSVTAEDFAVEDYAESTGYTAKGGRALSGSGYRRSRRQENRLKRDLRYGQYLEVPKGQRAIFSTQTRGRATQIATLIAVGIIIAVVILLIIFWPR